LWKRSLVLTKSGELYGFGYNNDRQIGCGNTRDQFTPIKINGFNNENIVSIACGGCHSLVLTDIGQVYGWGSNYYGQLGLGNLIIEDRPKRIDLNSDQVIKSISCGWNHSLLLTTDGDIYGFGLNSFGQIGNGNKTNQLNPVKIMGSQKFKEVVCYPSSYISVAKGVDDYFYVWGECENESFSTPNKTGFKSIHELLAKYSKIKIIPVPIRLSVSTSEESLTHNRTLETMLKIFNNPKYSDLIFKIENKLIYVQKCIIEINSKYFESKFTETTRAMRESIENKRRDNIIEITEYSYDVYYSFLKYLYTDFIDIKSVKAMELLNLANNYREEELKLKCVDIIKNDITLENVCSLYCSSIKYNLTEFEDYCFDFVVNKMNEICLTDGFREMDEISMKKLMEKVAKNKIFKSSHIYLYLCRIELNEQAFK
jgi:RCC1 and BTB domain-containing protein